MISIATTTTTAGCLLHAFVRDKAGDGVRGLADDGRQPSKGGQGRLVLLLQESEVPRRGRRRGRKSGPTVDG